MGKAGRSDPNLYGGYENYDAKGHKTGHSDPGLFGGYTTYDSHGHKTGRSEPDLFGGYTHYDAKGHKTGRSEPDLFGGYTNYDAKGHKTGHSDPGLFGEYSHREGDACYVATAVYGSYDCPEVWTLRRFRDRTLKASWAGRLFIRAYYAVSPALVRRFGRHAGVRRFCRARLDRLVGYLRGKGYENSPYEDMER